MLSSRKDDAPVTEAATEARPKTETEGPAGPPEQLVRTVEEALEAGEVERAAELAGSLHAADQADLLEQLGHDERVTLVAELKPQLDPELLTHLDEAVREEVLEQLTPEETGAAIAQLDTDDAIEILADLDETEQIAILQTLPMPERAAVEQGLTYPEDSAGRLMQRELVAAPEFWTVGQTIDYLRAKPDLPDEFYDIYIVNPRFEPVGSIPLSKIVRSKRGVLLTELRLKELHLIPFDMDQEEVGFVFRQYGLVSAPVVDANRRLLGVITVDDVVHVIEEEAEEDLLSLGGVQETSIFTSPWRASRQRVPWLLMSLVSSTLSASVIYYFNHSIEQLVALAVLMPVIAALGGNAGVQTLAVVVRALAVRELTRGNASTVLLKEIGVGVLNGSAVMFVGALVALIWFGKFDLALVFAVSVVATISAAALIGVSIPLLLDRLGFDPAIASSVFVTPTIDAIGFFTFLGIATLLLL
jgi:magnesium transporter